MAAATEALADLAKVPVSHRTNVGRWASSPTLRSNHAMLAAVPSHGGPSASRRAERMKRRRDVIMALAVRERELNGQNTQGV
jgi:hypothetical protein